MAKQFVAPKEVVADFGYDRKCKDHGHILRGTQGENLQGNFHPDWCIDKLGTLLARDPASNLIVPARAFGTGAAALGTIVEFCANFVGVAICVENTGGTEDGSADACRGDACPYCTSYSPCAVIEPELDAAYQLLEGQIMYPVVDPEHTGDLVGNLSDTKMTPTATADCELGAVVEATVSYIKDDTGAFVADGVGKSCAMVMVGKDVKSGNAATVPVV